MTFCIVLGGAMIAGTILIIFGGWVTNLIYKILGQK